MIDVTKNNTVGFTLSEAQIGYCEQQEFDEEDPRCARLSLSGKIVKVMDEEEIQTAEKALFSKHPGMESWYSGDGQGHDFGFWKLILEDIWLVDFFGGPAHISTDAWTRGTDQEDERSEPVSVGNFQRMASSEQADESNTESSSHTLSTIVLLGGFSCVAFFLGRMSVPSEPKIRHTAVADSDEFGLEAC